MKQHRSNDSVYIMFIIVHGILWFVANTNFHLFRFAISITFTVSPVGTSLSTRNIVGSTSPCNWFLKHLLIVQTE